MKLTPELYGAIIDEAHKRGLRVTAHVFTLEDAKGLLRAGLDAFAHGVRDRDIDDEGVVHGVSDGTPMGHDLDFYRAFPTCPRPMGRH